MALELDRKKIPGYDDRAVSETDLIDSPFKELILQIEAEYQASYKTIDPKHSEWQRRLKLYNNQRRDKDAVGDPLLFTTMQTIIAALYDDQLATEFTGRREGNEDVAENLNNLFEMDYDIMEKDQFDYYWDWDTCFFGRSIVYFTNFSREHDNTPIPDLQTPMLFFPDPKANSINGDILRRYKSRFFGRYIEMTMPDMDDNPEFFDTEMLRVGQTINSQVALSRQAYQSAQGLNQNNKNEEKDFKSNKMFELLEWCTHWKCPCHNEVRKVLVTLGNDRKKVVRYHEFMDADKKPAKTWPVIDRPMYPTAHDWFGTSVPDLVEDKQRIRAVMQNLAVKTVKAQLYPMYLYDKSKFPNRADFNFDFNKFIGVDLAPGDGGVSNHLQPIEKPTPNQALTQYILETLSQSAAQATSSPMQQQGQPNHGRKTAREVGTVDRNVGTRYSLTAKIWGWSEKKFCQQWYNLYKMHYKDHIHEKILRIEGAFGPKFRPLKRDNIILEVDPDIRILPKSITTQKRMQQRQDFTEYFTLVSQVPGANIRYGLKHMGRLIDGMEKDQVDRFLPPTIDEMLAEEENDQLSQGIAVKVKANDNHLVHLEVHKTAKDTDEAHAHIESHKKAIEIIRNNPEIAPQGAKDQMQQQLQQQNQQPNMQANGSTMGQQVNTSPTEQPMQ